MSDLRILNRRQGTMYDLSWSLVASLSSSPRGRSKTSFDMKAFYLLSGKVGQIASMVNSKVEFLGNVACFGEGVVSQEL